MSMRKTVVVEDRRSNSNGGKARINGQFGFDVSLVGDWKGIIYHELLPLNQCLQNGDYNRYIVVTIDISRFDPEPSKALNHYIAVSNM